MQPLLPPLSTQIETQRLILRPYQPGDEIWYFTMSQRNREHLRRYESGNTAMRIFTQQDAQSVIDEFSKNWETRKSFFLAAFCRDTQEFVAQIYIGVVNWELREFELGYFADVHHEGKGYVSEAANGALRFIFSQLNGQRVRLECDDTNVRSYKVAERCGMTLEAHFPENKQNADGSTTGTYHYGLSRTKYLDGIRGTVK